MKIFYLLGVEGYVDEELIENIAFKASKLSNNSEIITIGDATNGFNHLGLAEKIASYDINDEYVNIILHAHGIPLDKKKNFPPHVKGEPLNYYISTSKNELTGNDDITFIEEVFSEISKGVKNKPVKIYLTSCYGKYVHNHLTYLPKGSMVVNLSGNTETKVLDESLFDQKEQLLSNLISDKGFDISHLVASYCFNHQVKTSNPRIGVHTLDGEVKIFKIGDFMNKINFQSYLAKKLTDLEFVSTDHLELLQNKINCREIANIKEVRPNIKLEQILNMLESNTEQEIIRDLSDKYYPENALKDFSFTKATKFQEIMSNEDIIFDGYIDWLNDYYNHLEKIMDDTLKASVSGKKNNKPKEEMDLLVEKYGEACKKFEKIEKLKKQTENLDKTSNNGFSSWINKIEICIYKKINDLEDAINNLSDSIKTRNDNENHQKLLQKKFDYKQKLSFVDQLKLANDHFDNFITYEKYGNVSNYNVLTALATEAAFEDIYEFMQ